MMRFEEFCQHLKATGYRVRLSGRAFEPRAEKILEACRRGGSPGLNASMAMSLRGWLAEHHDRKTARAVQDS